MATCLQKQNHVYVDAFQYLFNTVGKGKASGNLEATVIAQVEASSGDNVDEEGDHVQSPSISLASGFPTPPRSASRQQYSDRFTPFQSALLQKLHWVSTDHGDEYPDRIYILSFLPDYKKVNNDEKIDFMFS